MIPIPLFKHSENNAALGRHARLLAIACDEEYRRITGKGNVLPNRSTFPVICIQAEAGYWQLNCNDPEISLEVLQQLKDRFRTYEKTLELI